MQNNCRDEILSYITVVQYYIKVHEKIWGCKKIVEIIIHYILQYFFIYYNPIFLMYLIQFYTTVY